MNFNDFQNLTPWTVCFISFLDCELVRRQTRGQTGGTNWGSRMNSPKWAVQKWSSLHHKMAVEKMTVGNKKWPWTMFFENGRYHRPKSSIWPYTAILKFQFYSLIYETFDLNRKMVFCRWCFCGRHFKQCFRKHSNLWVNWNGQFLVHLTLFLVIL